MTIEEKKRQHRIGLYDKKAMLEALVETWEVKCRKTYCHEDVEYLRDLKRRKRNVETRINALSL